MNILHKNRAGWLAASLAGALGVALATGAHADDVTTKPARLCASLVGLTLPGSTMQITKADEVAAAPPGMKTSPYGPPLAVGVPAYCKAEGVIDPRIGAGGKPYALGFAIALPDDWNGRFLFQGGGGMNGTVNPPFGGQAAGDVPALARGFAVISTDSGHKGAVFDPAFMADQEAILNFAQDSVGKVTGVGKRLVAAYYGAAPKRSYFVGCSTGGREAMLASQRYPDDFDGIVSGDPAMRTGNSNLGLAWASVAVNQIAPKDASGKPLTGQVFSDSDRKRVIDRLLADCDGLDGMKDGLIFNQAACHFDPAELTCKGKKTDACLTHDQVNALHRAFAGPKTKGGLAVYVSFPWDAGVASKGPGLPGFMPTGAAGPLGPPNRDLSMDVDQAAAKVQADWTQRLTDTDNGTNLSTFFGHGGKLIFYDGLSDPWFSPLDTLDYYQRMAAANGGLDAVRASSSRIFLVPGMSHCGGGPVTVDNFDMLSAMVDWVEKGQAPDSVVAKGASLPGQTRPLCAWPAHAQYKGAGDPKDAASYECKA